MPPPIPDGLPIAPYSFTTMTYFESLKAATGNQYKAILCQHLGAAQGRHVSAIRAWLSSGTKSATKSAFAEMISAEAHLEKLKGAIAGETHE